MILRAVAAKNLRDTIGKELLHACLNLQASGVEPDDVRTFAVVVHPEYVAIGRMPLKMGIDDVVGVVLQKNFAEFPGDCIDSANRARLGFLPWPEHKKFIRLITHGDHVDFTQIIRARFPGPPARRRRAVRPPSVTMAYASSPAESGKYPMAYAPSTGGYR